MILILTHTLTVAGSWSSVITFILSVWKLKICFCLNVYQKIHKCLYMYMFGQIPIMTSCLRYAVLVIDVVLVVKAQTFFRHVHEGVLQSRKLWAGQKLQAHTLRWAQGHRMQGWFVVVVCCFFFVFRRARLSFKHITRNIWNNNNVCKLCVFGWLLPLVTGASRCITEAVRKPTGEPLSGGWTVPWCSNASIRYLRPLCGCVIYM